MAYAWTPFREYFQTAYSSKVKDKGYLNVKTFWQFETFI